MDPRHGQGDGLGFEDLLDELEAIVQRLEGGELSLEESLTAYERGVTVSRQAEAILGAAERRIEVLSETGDSTAPLAGDAA